MKLIPHPAHPPKAKFAITANLAMLANCEEAVGYIVTGDVDAIRLPEAARPIRTDGLWQTTCFELFAGEPDSEIYYELNFSPSGQWAAYDFDRYRTGMRDRSISREIAIGIQRARNLLVLTAALDSFPVGKRIGFNAVIDELDGTKSWWALAHPCDRPDFHDPRGFIGAFS